MSDLTAKGVEVKISDLTGIGVAAKAIPPEVYTQAASTTLATFTSLTAPLTETTAGFGRYIRQKFDSMVEIERAVAAFSLSEATRQVRAAGKTPGTPAHPKSFVRSLEEASKETDPLLHQMWTSLLASQMCSGGQHPHFVQILSHLGRSDAELLLSLRSRADIGPNAGGVITFGAEAVGRTWVRHGRDSTPLAWTAGCDLLSTLDLVDVAARQGEATGTEALILFRTRAGDDFLRAVGAIALREAAPEEIERAASRVINVHGESLRKLGDD